MTTGTTRKIPKRSFHPGITPSAMRVMGIAWLAMVLCLLAHSPAMAVKPMVAAGTNHTVALRADGTVVAVGNNSSGQTNVSGWTDIVQVAAGGAHTVGLRADGTVVAVGDKSSSQTNMSGWTGIIQVAAGSTHTVGLRADGTVVAVGSNTYGQTNVNAWTNIIHVAAGSTHTVGVRADGTVVAVGSNGYGQSNVGDWTGIIQVVAGGYHTVGLRVDGTVVAVGSNTYGQTNVNAWTNIVQVATGWHHAVGLRSDGTVVAVGYNHYGQVQVGGWANIVQMAAGGDHTVGLRTDGTVVAVGSNINSQTNVGAWANIIQVVAGDRHTIGLRTDGTVVAVGYNTYGQTNMSGWTNIVQVAAGWSHSVGLRADGTVVAVGDNGYGQSNVGGWNGIVQVAAGGSNSAGLRANGTVVAVGSNNYGQTNVGDWTGIIQVAAGGYHTVGLRADGTVVALGLNNSGQINVSGWTGIAQVAASGSHTVGLRADGTVVAVGNNSNGQTDVSGWTNIVQVAAGGYHTVGLRADGTVVAAGRNDYGQTNVSGWNGIVQVAAGWYQTVGLAKNGQILGAGMNDYSQLNFFDWRLIPADYDNDGDGFTTAQGDCNEFNPAINPGTVEICDGVDNNCDGAIDEGFDRDGDGFTSCNGDCNDSDPMIHPNVAETCTDGIDNNCNGLIDTDSNCLPCTYDAQCGKGQYCKKPNGDCSGLGVCIPLPAPGTVCPQTFAYDPVCGCDGKNYNGDCEADLQGISVAATGECAASGYTWRYYFPAITDNSAIGWENYLTVQAKDPVPMDVTIRVYNMAGTLVGTFIHGDTNPLANAPAIPPYARVAARPSMIAGTQTTPIPVEGSMIVETSVPAIATTNTIANFFEGFSIYEAAKPRASHSFPKAYDGPNNYQVYLLVQNIYDTPVNVTVKLYGKTAASPGHGASRTVDVPAFGTLKVRPSEIASGINFDGSVVVTSNLSAAEDGLGRPIPAMCRYELGKEAMSIYESTILLPTLFFPVLKDGKFGGAMDYQNFLSVVNPTTLDATVEVVLYGLDGAKRGSTGPVLITADGKRTWRPSMIIGTQALPLDFTGAAIVLSSSHVIGQTNTIYPGVNQYNTDAFDLFESAMPTNTLFFPKAFDNIVATGHLYDNFVYIQNPDTVLKYIMIEQFNNNGTLNGSRITPLPANATYVYRPKDLVTDGTAQFRGSVRVTETSGGKITGAIKYDLHQGTTASTPVDAMTLYRSMGQ